ARVVADGVGHDLRDDEVAGEEIAGAVAPRLRRLLAPARDDERRGGPRKTLHFVSSSSCSAAVDATADAEIWPAARITISSVVCFCLSSYRRTSPRTRTYSPTWWATPDAASTSLEKKISGKS